MDETMYNDKVYLTPEGVEKLRQELDQLVNEKRPALAERLRHAIQQGDLSENADYQTAKEEQGFLEGRIRELESMLLDAVIIEQDQVSKDRVGLGSQVTVTEDGEDEIETFFIVGAAESDPANGRISNESPIGQALIDRKVGERVRVQAPAGEIIFTIQSIE
jgi:transcription elongation factor GreA